MKGVKGFYILSPIHRPINLVTCGSDLPCKEDLHRCKEIDRGKPLEMSKLQNI
ncbi:hypothetical protein [Hydrogenivirga sp. 128-5-R1-1]|uniref:hypothetical protein n=1 Tax=Hydrogenivirga sp. 128-5-R1-1 TaxID=392423 RepID=UPI0012F95B90|nr:hypothetical protein [Hydrogenivirga sp. 128-5-R1-1]